MNIEGKKAYSIEKINVKVKTEFNSTASRRQCNDIFKVGTFVFLLLSPPLSCDQCWPSDDSKPGGRETS